MKGCNEETALLLIKIQHHQAKMIQTAQDTGMQSQETIQCSEELDKLVIIYQRKMLQSNHVYVPPRVPTRLLSVSF